MNPRRCSAVKFSCSLALRRSSAMSASSCASLVINAILSLRSLFSRSCSATLPRIESFTSSPNALTLCQNRLISLAAPIKSPLTNLAMALPRMLTLSRISSKTAVTPAHTVLALSAPSVVLLTHALSAAKAVPSATTMAPMPVAAMAALAPLAATAMPLNAEIPPWMAITSLPRIGLTDPTLPAMSPKAFFASLLALVTPFFKASTLPPAPFRPLVNSAVCVLIARLSAAIVFCAIYERLEGFFIYFRHHKILIIIRLLVPG